MHGSRLAHKAFSLTLPSGTRMKTSFNFLSRHVAWYHRRMHAAVASTTSKSTETLHETVTCSPQV